MRNHTRSGFFLAAFCAAASAAALVLGSQMAQEQESLIPASAYERKRDISELWRAPAFDAVSQDGATVNEGSLRGHVWIASFLFTSCTTVCPTLAGKLAELQKRMPDPNLRFVSFSVDPARDTPDRLAAFADRFRPAGETRWLLLAPTGAELGRLLRGMHLAIEPSQDESGSIAHSTLLFLIDREGWVRGVFDSAASGDDALRAIERDVQTLGAPRVVSLNALVHDFFSQP